MIDTNSERVDCVREAFELWQQTKHMGKTPDDREQVEEDFRDLVTNLCHMLRIEHGYTEDEIGTSVSNAFEMFKTETEEDED